MVKKAHELALLGNLQITLVIADVSKNIIQEFISCDGMTVEKIAELKQDLHSLKLDKNMHFKINRR